MNDICSGWIKGNKVCAKCPYSPHNNPIQEEGFHSLHEECEERKMFRKQQLLKKPIKKRSRY